MFAKNTPGRIVLNYILLCIVLPVAILVTLFFGLRIAHTINEKNIKEDIFQLVLEQQDTLDQNYGRRVSCAGTGLVTGGTYYGYYYSANNTLPGGEPYKNGVKRQLGSNPLDWEYMEQICDNWFYYEEHIS